MAAERDGVREVSFGATSTNYGARPPSRRARPSRRSPWAPSAACPPHALSIYCY